MVRDVKANQLHCNRCWKVVLPATLVMVFLVCAVPGQLHWLDRKQIQLPQVSRYTGLRQAVQPNQTLGLDENVSFQEEGTLLTTELSTSAAPLTTPLATTPTTATTQITLATTPKIAVQSTLRPRKELKFIHITKTGGTAIEDWAKAHGLRWGRFHSEYRAVGRPGSPWHHPFSKLPSAVRHRYDWFMVVRNPVDRIVSEYYCPWTGTKTPEKDTEDAFNKFVQRSLDGRRFLHPGSFQAMSDYLDHSSVQHILHFESLGLDLARLLRLYGISFNGLPKKNVAVGQKFNSSNLWPKTLKMIRAKYATDFENFNYTCQKCPD